MILYPAVDIRGGQAVRLTQGDYDREQVYAADPVEAALHWAAEGAEYLHVVDLDGARRGRPVNLAQIGRMVAECELPIQLGGGLRDEVTVSSVLDAGVDRVVLGTVAEREPELVARLVDAHGSERIVAAVDSRAGKVSVAGWREGTGSVPADLVEVLAAHGARTFLYTPVEVDGTMEGPDLAQLGDVAERAAAAGAEVIYSGGVGELEHLHSLRETPDSVTGVIVGRALYERRFTVAEGKAALAGE